MNYTDPCAHLNRQVIEATPHVNCYSRGTDEYTRKDGAPLTEDDLRLLNFRGWVYKPNQHKSNRGQAGDLAVRVDWVLDTSG